MQTAEKINRTNGIDLSVLKETVSAMQKDPELGKSKFRARNKWIDANHNCTTISGFYGAKKEMKEPIRLSICSMPWLPVSQRAWSPMRQCRESTSSH